MTAVEVVAVAYSGGRDSTALLHATLIEAKAGGWRVVALHVHHGLNPAADDWLAHCAKRCRDWAAAGLPVDLVACRLTDRPAAGQSIEAWARAARYAALARLARDAGADVVLLGHHRRDQAETLLLQALRGGGVAGLAGMPERVEREGLVWFRPWLRRSRCEIDAYVQQHQLSAVEDSSNADARFARNRLRLDVWPALKAAFPHVDSALAASARWAQEADAALAELAAIDLAAVAGSDGLDIAAWGTLSAARRSLALRTWIRGQAGTAAPASLIERLLDELPRSPVGRWAVASDELQAYRGRLRLVRSCPELSSGAREIALSVDGVGVYSLPGWGGSLQVRPVDEGGVPLALLARIDLRARHGGERFQAGPGRPARSLKKQFQAAGIASPYRDGPLVYSGDVLVYVPGLGLDARVVGSPGVPVVTLQWLRPGASAFPGAGGGAG